MSQRESKTASCMQSTDKNPEDVFSKAGHKSQCPMTILAMRNGMKPMIKKYVLKSLRMQHLPAEIEFSSCIRDFKRNLE